MSIVMMMMVMSVCHIALLLYCYIAILHIPSCRQPRPVAVDIQAELGKNAVS